MNSLYGKKRIRHEKPANTAFAFTQTDLGFSDTSPPLVTTLASSKLFLHPLTCLESTVILHGFAK